MSPVDEDCKLDLGRSSQIHKGVHGSSYRTSSKQDVINKDYLHISNVKRDTGPSHYRMLLPQTNVIPTKSNVERSHWDISLINGLYFRCKPLCEVHSAALNAHKTQALGTLVHLDDLMGYPCEDPVNIFLIKELFRHQDIKKMPFPPSGQDI